MARVFEGASGHVVAIVAVVATVLGAAQTLGYGVEQFVAGVARASGGAWLLNPGGTASTVAIFVALAVIVSAATMPGMSGVGRGIKWLSNINRGRSIFVLLFFLIFCATLFSLQSLFVGMWDDLTTPP